MQPGTRVLRSQIFVQPHRPHGPRCGAARREGGHRRRASWAGGAGTAPRANVLGPGWMGWFLHVSAQCPGSHQQQQEWLRAPGVGGAIKIPWHPAAVGLQHRCSGRFSTGSSFHRSWLLLLWHCAAPVKVTAPHTLTPSHHLRPGPLQLLSLTCPMSSEFVLKTVGLRKFHGCTGPSWALR